MDITEVRSSSIRKARQHQIVEIPTNRGVKIQRATIRFNTPFGVADVPLDSIPEEIEEIHGDGKFDSIKKLFRRNRVAIEPPPRPYDEVMAVDTIADSVIREEIDIDLLPSYVNRNVVSKRVSELKKLKNQQISKKSNVNLALQQKGLPNEIANIVLDYTDIPYSRYGEEYVSYGRGIDKKEYSNEQLESMGFNDEEIDIIDEKLYGRGSKGIVKDDILYGEGSLPANIIKKYGQMASIAYVNNNNVIQELEKYAQTGWTLDSNLSDTEKKVLFKDDEVVVSYRGTDSTKDVLNDLSLLLGLDKLFSPRKRKERKHFKKVLQKYKGKQISLTGHSLGGKSVMNIILKYPTDFYKAYMINGASVHDTTAPLILQRVNKLKDAYNIRVQIDPVSVLNPFQQVLVKQSKGDPHTVNNFV